MQFEEQSAIRQMKELLRDQAKFRAKLDRVVRKIETSSERTAKLSERNKTRSKNGSNGNGESKGMKKEIKSSEPEEESLKVHGDKINGDSHEGEHHGHDGEEPHDEMQAQGREEAISQVA